MTRAVVTGGAGFIGSHVVDALLAHGCEVLVIDNLATGTRANVALEAELVVADISDSERLRHVLCGYAPDIVMHLAAQTLVAESMNRPAWDAEVNVQGTISLLQAVAAARCRKLVFASSSTVYGEPVRQPVVESDQLRPLSAYGVSKLAGEHYVRVLTAQHGMAHTILRLGNVVGPRDSLRNSHVIPSFAAALLAGAAPLVEWDGEQAKDYVDVTDVARAFVACLERGDGETFNIARGECTTVNELLRRVRAATGVQREPLHVAQRPGDVRRFVMDCTAAQQSLGWQPAVSLDSTIRRTLHSMSTQAHDEQRSRDAVTARTLERELA